MTMVCLRATTAAVAAAALIGVAGFSGDVRADEPTLPRSMVWSAYDLGASGYIEASAMANAFMETYDTRIRIVPSGTSIGRLLPMTQGRVTYGFLANEVYFATEGTYDFSSLEWGPQDLRIVLGKPSSNGMATAKDANIRTPEDLRGKRIGYVRGNPSVNIKNDAYLAFAGLTHDDVQVVWFGGYRDLVTAILANQLDVMTSVTTSANMREIEASPRGLYWPSWPAENREGWDKVRTQVADFFEPFVETRGAAISEDNPVEMLGYRYPMITVYAHVDADEIYNMTKAADRTFDKYKGATATGYRWEIEQSGRTPADAPWHEGAIRYLKEKGVWQAEDQEWHEARLARLQKVMDAWESATEEFQDMRAEKAAAGERINPDEAWPEFWDAYRVKHLGG